MNENEFSIIEDFERYHIILNGHFKLRSGKHSNMYISKDKLYTIPNLLANVLNVFANILPPAFSYDVVCGPAEAGIVLASAVGIGHDRPIVWTSKNKYGDLVVHLQLRDQFKEVVKE